jgi:hypothetical protein
MADCSFSWILPVDSWGDVLDLNLLETEKLLQDEGGLVVEALNLRYVPMVLVEIVRCLVSS